MFVSIISELVYIFGINYIHKINHSMKLKDDGYKNINSKTCGNGNLVQFAVQARVKSLNAN